MDTRLSQNSTANMSYKDWLRKSAQDQLDALSNQQSTSSGLLSQGQNAVNQGGQALNDAVNYSMQKTIPTSQDSPSYSLAGGQGSILSEAGPITENFGQSQPGVEVFSHGFTNGTGIGVPTGTKVALPPGQWAVLQSYNADNHDGHIGDGTNSGYGNSAFVENLQTGEKLRFSHLSKNGAQQGQVLPGGTVFGETGATGNVTGPHLNLEYYNPKGQLGNVLASPYSRYLFGNSSGNTSKGKGGGNPLMDAMGRLASGAKQTGQDFLHGYTSGPQDASAGEFGTPEGFGNFVANGTPAGEATTLLGHALGVVAPHLGQLAHAAPLMAGAITKYNKQIPQTEINDFAPALQRFFDQGQNLTYATSPHAANDENMLRSYASDYINRNFGNSAPLPQVAQELWNRALVDRQQISPLSNAQK